MVSNNINNFKVFYHNILTNTFHFTRTCLHIKNVKRYIGMCVSFEKIEGRKERGGERGRKRKGGRGRERENGGRKESQPACWPILKIDKIIKRKTQRCVNFQALYRDT